MKAFYAAKYEGAWYLFLASVFIPGLLISMFASELTVSETFDYTFSAIGYYTFDALAYVLYIPVGVVACMLPSDTYYIPIAFGLITFTGKYAIWMLVLFVLTTYPPFYRGRIDTTEGA